MPPNDKKDKPQAGAYSYLAVSEADPEILSKRITAFLNDGWTLVGGVVTSAHYDQIWFTQAIMKHDPWHDAN